MYRPSALLLVIVATWTETILLLKRFPEQSIRAKPIQIVLLLFSINLVTWRFYAGVFYPQFQSSLRHLPTAKRLWPLIGYGPAQFSNHRGAIFHQMSKAVPNDGLIRFQGFLDKEHLLLTSPEALAEVLVKRSYDFVKPPAATKIFNQFLGHTFLLVTEGVHHRLSKSSMQAPLNFRQVQEYYPTFWAKATSMADEMVCSIQRDDLGALVTDIEPWAHDATLDAIFGSMFGERLMNSPHKVNLLKVYEDFLSPKWDVQLFFMMTAFLPFWTLKLIPGNINQRMKTSSFNLRRAMEVLIEERRKDPGREAKNDISIQLIQRNYFSDEDLICNILGLLVAGIEPTTAGFISAISYLAMNPIWQTRLRDEIKANIPHKFLGKDATNFEIGRVLENLPILEAVLNETLRLMPPSPTSNRVTTSDTTIIGIPVPAGTKLFIPTYSANRSQDVWGSTAENFDPGRWLGDHAINTKVEKSKNYGFMPFLRGPRKCIGHIYAKAEILLFVAAFVGRFEFEMADNRKVLVPVGVLTLKPKNGQMKMRLVDAW